MEEDRQTTEVRTTNEQVGNTNIERRSVKQQSTTSSAVILQRIIYYIGGILLALLIVRIVLQLLAANEGNGFVDFIYGITTIFVLPFNGIFGEPTLGESRFDTSALVALIVYGFVTIGIAKLITLTRPKEEL